MTSIKTSKVPVFLKVRTCPPTIPEGDQVIFLIADFNVFPEIPVSHKELNRASQMKSVNARKAFLAGRRVVRYSLSRWLALNPPDISIRVSPEGAPYFEGAGMPLFSISHSSELVMVALSRNPVGADLERERPLDMVSLADRFFSKDESLFVRGKNDLGIFFRLWTCREAAIKADGRGMARLLPSTNVRFEDECVASAEVGGGEWKVAHAMIDQCYHAAIAGRQLPSLIHWCDLR
jgi:4'-phosphopantetheinyl transferase